MNGQPLTREHGYPLRVVAPGIVGARWVKWLTRIELRGEVSDAFAMQLDYKILKPPAMDGDEWIARVMGKGKGSGALGENGKDEEFREKLMKRHGPIMRMGVGSFIVDPTDEEEVEVGSKVKGYATGTDGELLF